jgi:hypothetical protein
MRQKGMWVLPADFILKQMETEPLNIDMQKIASEE